MPIECLDRLTALGQHIQATEDDAVRTHTAFERWATEVSDWLSERFPDSGLAAQWAAQPASTLVLGGAYYDDPSTWIIFRSALQTRLRWLSSLPLKVKMLNLSLPARTQNESESAGRKEVRLNAVARAYVDPDRINQLKVLKSQSFDLSRLVRLCEELNIAFAAECYLSMIMLTRAIIDHVPPIFSCKSFAEVTAQASAGRSLREAFTQLDVSSRKIADHYLHAHIRKSESLPNAVQVNFSNALDLLLGEVFAKLK